MKTMTLTPPRVPCTVVVSLLCAGVMSVALAPTPASATIVPEPVTVADARNDVRIFAKTTGLGRAARKSIDLYEAAVVPREESVRFTVRLRSLLPKRGADQMVFVDMSPAGEPADAWTGYVGFSPQEPAVSYGGFSDNESGTFASCDPLKATVMRATSRVRLDVPLRCIPHGEATIVVTSMTGFFRSDSAGPWSKDKVRFPVPVTLR